MKLTGVTLTGADNRVDPQDLYQLSDRFPFIEWGILIYPKKEGKQRYPDKSWISKFMRFKPAFVRTAAHICGDAAIEFLDEDNLKESLENYKDFDRIQVNVTYDQIDERSAINAIRYFQEHINANLHVCRKHTTPAIITQHNVFNERLTKARLDPNNIHHWYPSILFDESRGKGVQIRDWQKPFRKSHCGYAGGISPDNIESVLNDLWVLLDPDTDVWIDMESGIRTLNEFDLSKVEQVANLVDPFFKKNTEN